MMTANKAAIWDYAKNLELVKTLEWLAKSQWVILSRSHAEQANVTPTHQSATSNKWRLVGSSGLGA